VNASTSVMTDTGVLVKWLQQHVTGGRREARKKEQARNTGNAFPSERTQIPSRCR
jgi:hypothetical protein